MTTTKIIAFVDILGFSKMIEDYDNGNPQILENLISAMNGASNLIKAKLQHGSDFLFDFKECLEAKLFSDCLCVSVPLEFGNQFIKYNVYDQFWFLYQYLSGYQILLLERGIFTRGAITIGSYYSDENIIFSGGLVDAYNLESKVAKYPRIIVSDKLIDTFKNSELKNNWDYCKILNIDDTDKPFINPFNYRISTSDLADKIVDEFLSKMGTSGITDDSFSQKDLKDKNKKLLEALSFCEKELGSTTSDSIKEKYLWMIDFINFELSHNNQRKFRKFNF